MKHKAYSSLLWPSENNACFTLDEKSIEDLDLSHVFERHQEIVSEWLKATLRELPKDAAVVGYRQAVLRDFDNNRQVLEVFVEVGDVFYQTHNLIKFAFERDHTLYNVLKRIEDSEVILKGLYKMKQVLAMASLGSDGLIAFKGMLEELTSSRLFEAYESDLKNIRRKGDIKSLKLGLNLNSDMTPMEAIVLTLEEEPFKYTRQMKRITRVFEYGINELKKVPRRIFAPETVIPKENLNELEKIISPAMGQLMKFIDTFNDALLEVFEPLKVEMSYYTFAVRMKNSLAAMGHPLTQVSFSDSSKHHIQQMYNANLAYRLQETGDKMVYNDVTWVDRHIYVLTGSNRGGKTTFTQAIGQIYWLGMLGFYVPAVSADLPVIDGLFVHFPIEENETVLFGRLGEECQRFSELFGQMTSKSLLLMNESFSGTSHGESLKIAEEALKATAKIGLSGLFNTHLHELAGDIDALNLSVKEDHFTFSNLVSGSKEHHQSFLIKEGEPLGKSYAHDIAVKYGISYEQLVGEE